LTSNTSYNYNGLEGAAKLFNKLRSLEPGKNKKGEKKDG
jgi:hypothetical protein